ncbi:hypothetical protein CO038_00570 [Candidatus Pacearchaeota archaeon CG_4_9_14_0_2_um_filter_39_13]|nr:DNA primase [Candidatus Pacearchaeota archaeon]OIO42982.1 MAG: hypothetical protein AUJ64_03355 [Candidatus Pacearchaeota archaeon CG1_02_39_14]PJC45049.1 MAG: hypothetical protein CO038_00570 [Candidatus Pacearchaeota archaeon CG_4_9_14_0_2_um_filter_39_13]
MAKISPVSIKYMIHANFKAEGPVEKPDVIGAIFGQTEGLLGRDMEMRELQKEGKIGRIEVELETVDGKSIGEIKVPSALDKSETTIIAATLETIDRIGPTEAKIEISKIEDVRGSKRDYIIERAKKLLDQVEGDSMGGMSKALKEESRTSKVQEYGEERLAAGDLSGDEVIVVEGRADVLNLLRNRVNNVIGMMGVKMPKEIRRLGEEKELTLFVDGDRGGKLIAKNVIENAKITYVAVAPDGKEVEELTGKEILQALRRKVPTDEFLKKSGNGNGRSYRNEDSREEPEEISVDPEDAKKAVKEKYKDIKDTRKAIFLDSNLEVVKELSSRDVPGTLKRMKNGVAAVIIDGMASSMIIKACDEEGVKFLGATNFSATTDSKVKLISL